MKLISGGEAIAQGALDAGVNFFSVYPRPPVIDLSHHLAAELPKRGGRFIQMEDDTASLGAAVSASAVGMKAMFATSGPGLSHAQEMVAFASINEVPLVIIHCMTMGPSTGLVNLTMQADIMSAKWGAAGDYPIIALVPSSPREAYDLTIQSFNLSEKFRIPVIILTDQMISSMRESVDFRENPKLLHRTPYRQHFLLTGQPTGPDGLPTHNHKEIKGFQLKMLAKWNEIDRITSQYEMDDARTAIITYGITSRAAKAAVKILRSRKQRVGLLKLTTLWPQPRDEVLKVLKKVDRVVVAEANWGQLFKSIRGMGQPSVDLRSVTRIDGKLITPKEIIDGIAA